MAVLSSLAVRQRHYHGADISSRYLTLHIYSLLPVCGKKKKSFPSKHLPAKVSVLCSARKSLVESECGLQKKEAGKNRQKLIITWPDVPFLLTVVLVLSLHSELGLRVFHLPAARSNLDEIYYY